MKPYIPPPPTRRQRLVLRSMIVIGITSMGFFMHSLLNADVRGYKPLYLLLIFTFIYTFFKILYEWYHYWSISVPDTPPRTRNYSVDVFTTFCPGEPYDMIIDTLKAVKAITYPHETYLCDEADDPYLRQVCNELGVHHVTRTVKVNAKAGNINNALRQSTGELCVVLDPDHIPVPEFLDPVVSHFDNPGIGFVQVVQAYYNQDTGLIAKGAAQQTYQFYGPMMMTMNSYGTVQAIGANCTFRRAALDSIGGHAAGLAEDMHTAMQLHAKGWKSVYVPAVVTRGLVPATLSAYYKQQLKWSRGVFELLVTSYITLFRKFTWRQKLHYGLIPMFYLSGFVFLINFLIPVISLFTGLFPLKMDFSSFAVVSVPLIASVIMIRHYVQQWVMGDDETGFHVVGGLLLIGTWWLFILGFVYTIIRKNVPYIPTPKGLDDEDNLNITIPNICVFAITTVAIFYGLYTDWNPFTIFMAGIATLNCVFMAFMFVAGQELQMQQQKIGTAGAIRFIGYIKYLKGRFWLFRRKVYAGVRGVSLILVVLIVCLSIYAANNPGDTYVLPFKNGNRSLMDIILGRTKHPFLAGAVAKFTVPDKPDTDTAENRTFADSLPLPKPAILTTVKGVTYSKGNYWYKNMQPLNHRIIEDDFDRMKALGINTVKIFGPTVYDQPVLGIAADHHMKIQYSFWVPDPANFVYDADRLKQVTVNILNTIDKLKDDSTILSWNIGNPVLQKLDRYYQKKQLSQAKYKYVAWLKQLVNEIKSRDNHRRITVDLMASPTAASAAKLMSDSIAGIDAFGLIAPNRESMRYAAAIRHPWFYGSVDAVALPATKIPHGGVFFKEWQDQITSYAVVLDGLKDMYGRNKPALVNIKAAWSGKAIKDTMPYLRILRPALNTRPGAYLPYYALTYSYNKWHIAAYSQEDVKFEWYIVRTDQWGNGVSMYPVGHGPQLNLLVPSYPEYYRLYLIASRGHQVSVAYSTLNTPLPEKPSRQN